MFFDLMFALITIYAGTPDYDKLHNECLKEISARNPDSWRLTSDELEVCIETKAMPFLVSHWSKPGPVTTTQ